MPFLRCWTTLALLLAATIAPAAEIERQRELFLQLLPQAEAGRWDLVAPQLEALGDYPLLPDLRAAWFRHHVGRVDDAQLGAFLEAYPELGFSANLRRQWAGSLAKRGQWRRYLELYEARYATAGDTVLHCHAYTARLRLGRTAGLEEQAIRTWLAPLSQPAECDPAFEWLEQNGALTATHRRERMELALGDGQLGLARWLARSLDEPAVAAVERWQRMHSDPAGRLGSPGQWRDTPEARALLLYGFRRLASADPVAAARRWPEFREHFAFEARQRAAMDRRIATTHAWRHLSGAAAQLEALPPESHNAETRSWAVRIAIRNQDWEAIGLALARLEPEVAAEPVWRYWQARVHEAAGRDPEAVAIYRALAAERGYYSFLSADRIDADYNWLHATTEPSEELIAALDGRSDIGRARELFLTGLEATGRIEWQQAMAKLSPVERAQASILASRWAWHSSSIVTASGGETENDLELRFPLPWRPVFEARSARAGISSAWAYGVARSESLFMPDANSVAGAIGLMQLMPGTGKLTASRAGISYQGHSTLLDPEANVALGTTYLAQMLQRFGNHQVLATAAYNAGPNRVDRWLPESEPLSAEAWVDSVPYSETRAYVQRVLAAEAVFQWRLSGETVRIADAMQPVPPKKPQ
jgi:soluble lytic murein transglycosylase